jgi:uncharacterized membrane protein YqjE
LEVTVSHTVHNGHSPTAILSDIKEEIKDFLQTRIELLQTEIREKLAYLKIAAPLAAAGLMLVVIAYLLITFALAAGVAAFFASNAYRWVFGFAIVGVLWGVLGGVAAYFAKRELELKNLAPKRTLEVLKGDKVWLNREMSIGHEHFAHR